MERCRVLNTPTTQAKLQIPKLRHKAAHTSRLLQIQKPVPQLHLLVDLTKLRFKRSHQVIQLDLLEDRCAVLGITPPPRKRVTLKVTHYEAQSGAAGTQPYGVHILAHLEQKVIYFRLLSGESRRFR